MNPRLTQPLFGDSATGTLRDVGNFTNRNGATFVNRKPKGNKNGGANNPVLIEAFRIKHAEWMAIVPELFGDPPNHRWRRYILWPDFWAEFLSTWVNDSPRAGVLTVTLAPDLLNSSGVVADHIGSTSTNWPQFTITASGVHT